MPANSSFWACMKKHEHLEKAEIKPCCIPLQCYLLHSDYILALLPVQALSLEELCSPWHYHAAGLPPDLISLTKRISEKDTAVQETLRGRIVILRVKKRWQACSNSYATTIAQKLRRIYFKILFIFLEYKAINKSKKFTFQFLILLLHC